MRGGVKNAAREPKLLSNPHGAWRSLVSALVWGTRGPEFKSRRPDEKPAGDGGFFVAAFFAGCRARSLLETIWKPERSLTRVNIPGFSPSRGT
jgi:hypothetical protein